MSGVFSRHRTLIFVLFVAFAAALLGIGGLAGDVIIHLGDWIHRLTPWGWR